jgi:hypothetical protein
MGQSAFVQFVVKTSSPLHGLPPFRGFGALHFRLSVLVPVPQVTEQGLWSISPTFYKCICANILAPKRVQT